MSQKRKPGKDKLNTYLKYSGLAIQLFALILIAALVGQKLDDHFQTSKPYITAALVVFFTLGYFYKIIRDLSD